MTYKRKLVYQNEAVAEAYFDTRFSHPRGREENEATRLALERALNSIPGPIKILDMPCGSGRFTSFFCEKGCLYFGADISMEMMKVLDREQRAEGRTPSLVQCDREQLPFKDNAFDCVVCVRFLSQAIPETVRRKVLKELERILKKWLIVQSNNLKSIGPFVLIKLFLRELFGRDVSKYRFRKEILSLGWKEEGQFWIQGINRYIGVYQKAAQAGRVE